MTVLMVERVTEGESSAARLCYLRGSPACLGCGLWARPPSRDRAARVPTQARAPRIYIYTIPVQSQSHSQFIKDKRLHVNTRNIQRQLYPCTATAEVD